jgi:hypothetical protein
MFAAKTYGFSRKGSAPNVPSLTIDGALTVGGAIVGNGGAGFTGNVTVSAGNLDVDNNVSGTRFLAGFGTAAAPAFSFAADDDNGLYRSAANTAAISGGGSSIHTFGGVGSTAVGFLLASGSLQVQGNLTANGAFGASPRVVDIDNAADTISPSGSSFVRVTMSAGSIVITAAPFIANGVTDGDEVLIVRHTDAGDLTLPDETTTAGSNLRLGAATRVLGPRDSLRLRWNAAIADWTEVAYTNAL